MTARAAFPAPAGAAGRRPAAPLRGVLAFLARAYPDARILLDWRSPFELLVATVLAAQCTDARVNTVTPGLFRRWPTPEALAAARPEDVEAAVRPTGFYRNKAKALRGLAEAVAERPGGTVPATLEELTALPGVGRKTAAILLCACFDTPALPVDTHVGRVSFRLGLTSAKDPDRIERDLAAVVPRERWWEFATRLGWHGRRVCVARRPRCPSCGLREVCPRRGVAP